LSKTLEQIPILSSTESLWLNVFQTLSPSRVETFGGSIPAATIIEYVKSVIGPSEVKLGLRLIFAMDDELRKHQEKTKDKK